MKSIGEGPYKSQYIISKTYKECLELRSNGKCLLLDNWHEAQFCGVGMTKVTLKQPTLLRKEIMSKDACPKRLCQSS